MLDQIKRQKLFYNYRKKNSKKKNLLLNKKKTLRCNGVAKFVLSSTQIRMNCARSAIVNRHPLHMYSQRIPSQLNKNNKNKTSNNQMRKIFNNHLKKIKILPNYNMNPQKTKQTPKYINSTQNNLQPIPNNLT